MEKMLLSAIRLEAKRILSSYDDKLTLSQKCSLPEKDFISAELEKQTANATILDNRSITLYEEFAEGNIDKDAYIAAKTANNNDLDETKTRIVRLTQRLTEIDSGASRFGSTEDEPILYRVLNATETTSEIMSLLDRIIVYDDKRIEIRFSFGN